MKRSPPECACTSTIDKITSTHRGHGHCLAKGCDVYGMMAEIYGKKSGLCAGKGGSMHIADLSKGMLGANNVTELGGTARLNTGSAQYPNRIKDGNLSGS